MEFYYHEVEKDVLILAVDGGLDASTIDEFQKSIDAIADMGVKKIIVDCEKLSYISSRGLAALVMLHKRASKHGAEVKVAGAKAFVLDVLRLTKLESLFALYPDVNRARLAFRGERE